jgi:hypothetical protein
LAVNTWSVVKNFGAVTLFAVSDARDCAEGAAARRSVAEIMNAIVFMSVPELDP